MFYNNEGKNFKQHVHSSLQRRIRLFFGMGGVMLAVVLYDVVEGTLSPEWALVAIVIGTAVGWITSRILHLSWSHDGNMVVSRIDTVGWIVLVAYLLFEIVRSSFFAWWMPSSATAITFAFISAALISRVFGLRGKIVKILKDEKVFG